MAKEKTESCDIVTEEHRGGQRRERTKLARLSFTWSSASRRRERDAERESDTEREGGDRHTQRRPLARQWVCARSKVVQSNIHISYNCQQAFLSLLCVTL